MSKIAMVAALSFLVPSLAACGTAPNGDISIGGVDVGISQTQLVADEKQALNTACPILVVFQANPPAKMSAVQSKALDQLKAACDAPPTDVVMLAADILSAYNAIAPLVHK